jgi:hypothetical protein
MFPTPGVMNPESGIRYLLDFSCKVWQFFKNLQLCGSTFKQKGERMDES